MLLEAPPPIMATYHRQARALQELAITERLHHALPEAADHYEQASAAFHELGDAASAATATNGLGLVRLAQRDFDAADAAFAHAIAHAEDQVFIALVRANQATALSRQGMPAEAADAAEAALTSLAATGYQGPAFAELRRVLIRSYTELGAFEQAQQHLDAAEQDTDLTLRVLLLADRANLALATGQPQQALDLMWQAEQLGRTLADPGTEAEILTYTGRALGAVGRHSEAAAALRLAVQRRRQLPNPFLLAEALTYLRDALASAGEADAAASARAEAAGLVGGLIDLKASALRAQLDAES